MPELKIAGVVVAWARDTLNIRTAIEQRSVASFAIVDILGASDFSQGQSVEIKNDGALEFAGVIDSTQKTRIGAGNSLLHRISCVDWHYFADKRIAAESYTSQTAGYIFGDLVTKYLVDEGITVGTIQLGTTVREMVINYVPLTQAFDKLSEAMGFIWYIAPDKKIYFVERSTTPAPFAIGEGDILTRGHGFLDASPQYRNRQYVRAGRDITDTQVETRTGDGTTKAFAMGYPLAQVPAITVNAVTKTVGIKGLDTAKDFYWNKGDPIVTAAAAPSSGASIVITYKGEYNIMVLAEDPTKITSRKGIEGGTGLVENVADEPSMNTRDAAFDSAKARLSKYGVEGQKFEFATGRIGLKSGQLVTVTCSPYGVSATPMLIEAIDIYDQWPILLYGIVAIVGPTLGDWTGFFKDLAEMKEGIIDRLNIGSGQILIILSQFSEGWAWSESSSVNVFACPVPSTTLYPNSALYPC